MSALAEGYTHIEGGLIIIQYEIIDVMIELCNSKIGSVVHPSIIRDSSILLRNSENIMKRYKESIDKIIDEYNNSMNLYPNSIDLYFNDSVIYYLLSECEYENVYKFY